MADLAETGRTCRTPPLEWSHPSVPLQCGEPESWPPARTQWQKEADQGVLAGVAESGSPVRGESLHLHLLHVSPNGAFWEVGSGVWWRMKESRSCLLVLRGLFTFKHYIREPLCWTRNASVSLGTLYPFSACSAINVCSMPPPPPPASDFQVVSNATSCPCSYCVCGGWGVWGGDCIECP